MPRMQVNNVKLVFGVWMRSVSNWIVCMQLTVFTKRTVEHWNRVSMSVHSEMLWWLPTTDLWIYNRSVKVLKKLDKMKNVGTKRLASSLVCIPFITYQMLGIKLTNIGDVCCWSVCMRIMRTEWYEAVVWYDRPWNHWIWQVFVTAE